MDETFSDSIRLFCHGFCGRSRDSHKLCQERLLPVGYISQSDSYACLLMVCPVFHSHRNDHEQARKKEYGSAVQPYLADICTVGHRKHHSPGFAESDDCSGCKRKKDGQHPDFGTICQSHIFIPRSRYCRYCRFVLGKLETDFCCLRRNHSAGRNLAASVD